MVGETLCKIDGIAVGMEVESTVGTTVDMLDGILDDVEAVGNNEGKLLGRFDNKLVDTDVGIIDGL